MSAEDDRSEAARRVALFARQHPSSVLGLARHAALPVALDPGLVHLLRTNFFLDHPDGALPPTAEADLLLSNLCHEVGDGLFEVDPSVRDLLLEGLTQERLREVATLLWQYTTRRSPWLDDPLLERAQQLTALSVLDPDRARRWLDEAEARPGPVGTEEKEWFVVMRRELEQHIAIADRHSSKSYLYKTIVFEDLGITPGFLQENAVTIWEKLNIAGAEMLREQGDLFAITQCLHLASSIVLMQSTNINRALDRIRRAEAFRGMDPTMIAAIATLYHILDAVLAESEIRERIRWRFEKMNWLIGVEAMRTLGIESSQEVDRHSSKSYLYKTIVFEDLGITPGFLQENAVTIWEKLNIAGAEMLREQGDLFAITQCLHLASSIVLMQSTNINRALDRIRRAEAFRGMDPTMIAAIATLYHILDAVLAESEIRERIRWRFEKMNWLIGVEAMRTLRIEGSPAEQDYG